MTDLLTRLASRALGAGVQVRPRTPPPFSDADFGSTDAELTAETPRAPAGPAVRTIARQPLARGTHVGHVSGEPVRSVPRENVATLTHTASQQEPEHVVAVERGARLSSVTDKDEVATQASERVVVTHDDQPVMNGRGDSPRNPDLGVKLPHHAATAAAPPHTVDAPAQRQLDLAQPIPTVVESEALSPLSPLVPAAAGRTGAPEIVHVDAPTERKVATPARERISFVQQRAEGRHTLGGRSMAAAPAFDTPEEPVVQVTIGRVEIRATVPPAPAAPPRAVGSEARRLSLSDYLSSRNSRSR